MSNIRTYTLLEYHTHSGDLTEQSITSDPMKAASYHICGFGKHTFLYQIQNFMGRVLLQASLETDPSNWFTIAHDEYLEAATLSKVHNIEGNFVWVRAMVEYTQGTVNKIQVNY